MSRFCPRCNRPLVIFRGFWQCKHCIEAGEFKQGRRGGGTAFLGFDKEGDGS